MNGRIFSIAPDEKNGVSAPPQRQVVRAVDLADPEWRLALRTRNTHLALIIHAIGGVRFVLVRKGVTVARDLLDCVVAGDVPETAVFLVPRHRAAAAQVRVDLALVQVELVGVVIESDDHVGTDVGTAHWAIFAFLGNLSPREVNPSKAGRKERPSADGR